MTTVRHLLRDDVVATSALLARAFHDDPVWSWVLPDPQVRAAALPPAFEVFVRAGLRHGHTYVLPGAAAVWSPPDVAALDEADGIAFAQAIGGALGSRFEEVMEGLSAIGATHPHDRPHFYLFLIGTEPEQRGRGRAGRLLRHVLDTCDREGLASYLESSNPVNVALYERFGFQVEGQVQLPDGPSLDLMWREPAAG